MVDEFWERKRFLLAWAKVSRTEQIRQCKSAEESIQSRVIHWIEIPSYYEVCGVTFNSTTQDLREDFPSLAGDLREEPMVVLQSLGLAVSQVLSKAGPGESQQVACLVDLPYIQARISNFEPVTPLKSLKANYCGKFVAIHGTVVRVSNVKPLVTKMAFSCNLCGETQAIHLKDGKYSVPTKCSSSDCRGRSFYPERSSPLTETIDWQTIR
ncbi:DNA helicase MCM8-like isoform X2 [Montipora foliosa]